MWFCLGFLCTALLKAGVDEHAINQVMNYTAQVAEWQQDGKGEIHNRLEWQTPAFMMTNLNTSASNNRNTDH